MFDITPYLIGLISLITLFIATWLVPLIKSKTTKEQQETIQAIADTVVYAAEQLFGSGMGKTKLEYAKERANERLKKYGIKLDEASLRPYIEAAVKALNLRQEWVDPYVEPVPGLSEFLSDDKEKEE